MVEKITLVRPDTQQSLLMDQESVPGYIIKTVDWGAITGTHHTYKYLNQVGVSVTNTSLETRAITIEGWVVAVSEANMSQLKNFLNNFINPQFPIDVYYNEYKLRFIPDKTVTYSINLAENNDIISKFQILGTAHDPLFTDDVENQVSFATTKASFHFPLVISPELPEGGVVFGVRTDSLIASVINQGSVPTGMRILMRAKGSLSNPKLININTQEKLYIQKDLVADEEIEIVTSIGSKKVMGRIGQASEWVNYFVYRTLDSSWLQLYSGENLFRYDADEGIDNLEVFVYFENKYLEVQECY